MGPNYLYLLNKLNVLVGCLSPDLSKTVKIKTPYSREKIYLLHKVKKVQKKRRSLDEV
jgi:hypothetical protein